jgi:hypothetical protein
MARHRDEGDDEPERSAVHDESVLRTSALPKPTPPPEAETGLSDAQKAKQVEALDAIAAWVAEMRRSFDAWPGGELKRC